MALRFLLVLVLSVLAGIPAHAQKQQALSNVEAEIDLVEQEIADLELLVEMRDADVYIPKRSRCSTYLELASGYRDELKALNQRYAGRYDSAYRERAKTLVQYNKDALREYESCFASVAAQRYLKIRAAKVYAINPFNARLNELNDWFGAKTNLRTRWAELQRELKFLKEQRTTVETFAGTIASVFRTATITRGKETFRAGKNQKVFVGDIITTGSRGRVRIELNDRIPAKNVGPTTMNIGNNSRVVIKVFSPRTPSRSSLVDLVRGSIRSFTRGFSGQAAFSVRTGTSLCGIRGTEILIEHDDRTGTSRHWLLHGNADLKVGSKTYKLKPMHVVTTPSNGQSRQRSFRRAEYDARGNSAAQGQTSVAAQSGNNINLPGGDYRSFFQSSSDPRICAAACGNDGRCRAWTWVRPGVQGQRSKCWLKNRVPSARSSHCCVSGVKQVKR